VEAELMRYSLVCLAFNLMPIFRPATFLEMASKTWGRTLVIAALLRTGLASSFMDGVVN
jgi:hypothetical protein